LADQAVTVTATDTRIEVLAQQKLVLQAGQSRITLEGGNITFECPGDFTVKGSEHALLGGENKPVKLQPLPVNLVDMFSEQFHLVADENETALAGVRYRITGSDGQVWEGITDTNGLTERVYTHDSVKLTVVVIEAESNEGRIIE
ncbi:MAG: DUF2345 domain-containing protein, partial [Pseudomonas sp.]